MAKGAAIKFKSYTESVPKLLELLHLHSELKKYDKIVIKPHLTLPIEQSTPIDCVETVLKFCLKHKNPVAEVFIAEGADGQDTGDLFHELGYEKLAENYPVSLVDLNTAETNKIEHHDFLKFSEIEFPSILSESFVISLPKLSENEETGIIGSLSTMLGAFPANHYKGFFSRSKSKIRKWPIKYSIHDILKCKMPNLAVIDASSQGTILAGKPFELDKRSSQLLNKEWQRVPYLNLLHEEGFE